MLILSVIWVFSLLTAPILFLCMENLLHLSASARRVKIYHQEPLEVKQWSCSWLRRLAAGAGYTQSTCEHCVPVIPAALQGVLSSPHCISSQPCTAKDDLRLGAYMWNKSQFLYPSTEFWWEKTGGVGVQLCTLTSPYSLCLLLLKTAP